MKRMLTVFVAIGALVVVSGALARWSTGRQETTACAERCRRT